MPRSRSARGRSPRCSRSSRSAIRCVTVELGLNDRLVDLADEGWDLAIRIGSLSDLSLIARRIAPCRTVVCAAPSYLAARGHPRTVELGQPQLSWLHALARDRRRSMGVRREGGSHRSRCRKSARQQWRSPASRRDRGPGARLPADFYRCRRHARGHAGRARLWISRPSSSAASMPSSCIMRNLRLF